MSRLAPRKLASASSRSSQRLMMPGWRQKGSMFSIPVNAWYRLVNAASGGALLLSGNTAPNVLNLLNNVDAVFDNSFIFRDRFSGADEFFKPNEDIEPDPVRGLAMRRTNF